MEEAAEDTVEVRSSGPQGIDITGFANVKAIGGLFTSGKIEAWGFIVPTNTNRLMYAEGDTVYIRLAPGRSVHVGDELSIAQAGSWLKHPVTGETTTEKQLNASLNIEEDK